MDDSTRRRTTNIRGYSKWQLRFHKSIISKVDAAATSAEERATAKTTQVYKRKLADVERQIMPLLVNLLKTADKEYIHWPNREAQLEDKIEQILAITRDD